MAEIGSITRSQRRDHKGVIIFCFPKDWPENSLVIQWEGRFIPPLHRGKKFIENDERNRWRFILPCDARETHGRLLRATGEWYDFDARLSRDRDEWYVELWRDGETISCYSGGSPRLGLKY